MKFKNVAVGGTFDHFHKGHEKLLNEAFKIGDNVLIGVTSDEFGGEKGNIEPCLKRISKLEEFLQKFDSRYIVKKLEESYGPTIYDSKIDAIVVSRETKPTADKINEIRQVVPKTDDKRFIPAFGDAFLLGVSRGCTRGCRFCMAGCIYRPRRETSLKKLFKIAEKGKKATGLNKIALIGADVSGYSKIEELCQGLMERGFKVTSPSLRMEAITSNLIDILGRSGLKTITIAPESTWGIRKVLNKPITDEQVFDVMKMAFKRNMNVKLYFLVGLPAETTADIHEMVDYINTLKRMSKRKNAVRISINPFIPKPHTPFQWESS